MAITIKLFGKLSDVGGDEFTAPPQPTVRALIAALAPPLVAALREPRIRHAVNGRLSAQQVVDGDEIAFFSPVSGG